MTPLKQAKNDASKETQKEFTKELRVDPVIEETLYIMKDMISQ